MPNGDALARSAIAGKGSPARCGQGSQGVKLVRQVLGAGTIGHPPIFSSFIGNVRGYSAQFGLSGITRDAAGAPLGGCTVKLFADGSDVLLYETISDGGGFFSFTGIGVGSVYATAYLDGSPEVAGITIHDLSPIVVG